MLDIRLIRENPKTVEDNLKRRHDPEKLKAFKELVAQDKGLRDIIKKVEALKHDKNLVTREIAKSKSKDERAMKIERMKNIGSYITELDKNSRQRYTKQILNHCHWGFIQCNDSFSLPYGSRSKDVTNRPKKDFVWSWERT